jgi:hypothetical protein
LSSKLTDGNSCYSDGTFDADKAVGTATTVSSEVPIQTSTIAGDLKAIKSGNNNLIAIGSTTEAASAAVTTSAKAQGTPLQAGNKLIGAAEPTAARTVGATPATKDSSATGAPSTTSDAECEMEMVTVTVTVTAKPDAGKRHLARRSRQHMLANFD